ncbi:MAG: HD domain-containing protein [Peptostreptococcales bacterium]
MKNIYIQDLNARDSVEDFFMIKKFNIKTSTNNKPFCDMTLVDSSGEINAKIWDIPKDFVPFSEGSLVKIRGTVSEWNGSNQVVITKIRLAVDSDQYNISDFLMTAPEDSNTMYAFIYSYADKITDSDLRALTTELLTLHKKEMHYFPAAMSNHHSIFGGLLYHTKRMLEMAEKMCQVYTMLNSDYLYCGVILHDIGKIYELQSNEHGIVSSYTKAGQLLGHIIQGIKLVHIVGSSLNIDEDKLLLVEHMLLSHHNEPEYGSPKRPMFPEAEMLHYLDIMDATIYDMEYALDSTSEGEFSDKVWTLNNRKLYKKKDMK